MCVGGERLGLICYLLFESLLLLNMVWNTRGVFWKAFLQCLVNELDVQDQFLQMFSGGYNCTRS